MKPTTRISTIMLLITILGLTGCATNRGIVSLQLPESTTVVAANGEEVYLESVIDKRIFEEKPRTQDIPSLGFGGAEKATAEIKKRSIARKRNGFGQAMGDILLQEGQTVETVIAATLKRAFLETGYKVLTEKEQISANTIIVKVTIQKFWAYMTPGFWAITLSSDISTNMEMRANGNNIKTITVHSDGKYQVATEGNWMEVIDLSIQKYLKEVKNEI
ncbi:MAG: hypothetical protein KAU22_02690 [Desulfuromonadales bacterium]|nr:hypothetical protein [Desulfuromonadales bacterium]